MRFCEVCESVLAAVFTQSTMHYKCTRCEKKFDSVPNDTLRFKETFDNKTSSVEYKTMLRNAPFDNTNPRIIKKCTKCDNDVLSYVVLGESMVYVYTCVCGNQFT
jgi:DNA-directed RNA polymerase subunit M/transcription elongation factor TFIIS